MMNTTEIDFDKYQDRTDVNEYISLFEHGYIRNSVTDEILVCLNRYDGSYIVPSEDDDFDMEDYTIKTTYISLEDVKEALQDISDGYYSFIGSDRQTELANLTNNHLTIHIISIDMYDGRMTDYLRC